MVDDSSASKYGILSITPPATRHNQNHKPHHSRTTADSTTSATAPTTGLSFCNPVYELSNPSAGESTLDWRDWRSKENGDSTKERKDNKEKILSEDVISARPSTPPPALPNVAFKGNGVEWRSDANIFNSIFLFSRNYSGTYSGTELCCG